MKYKLLIERAAQKELSKIPHRDLSEIITIIKDKGEERDICFPFFNKQEANQINVDIGRFPS